MSNSKYIRLQELVIDTFNLDAPVEIEKGALLLESASKTVLLQLRLNVLDNVNEISSISVNVYGFTDSGEEVEGFSSFVYNYSDVYLQGSKTFGDKTPIILDSKIRRVTAAIEKVVYRNGDVWRNTGADIQKAAQKSIKSIDTVLLPQYEREISNLPEADKQKFLYIPQQFDDYWLCTCGTGNKNTYSTCRRCGLKSQMVFAVTNTDHLQKNLDKYIEDTRIAEELRIDKVRIAEERRLKAEAERKIIAAKRGRQLKAIMIPLLVACSLLALFFFVIQPAIKYSKATDLLENKYFDSAISAFTALGDYKDSADMVKESTYQKGIDLLANKRFDDSIAIFAPLEDYRDSPTMINEGYYQKATELLENGEYDDAFILFSSLEGYRDSSLMAQEATYQKANELLENENFEEARKIFSSIPTYKDSSTLSLEANFQIATGLLAQEEFESARTLFVELGDYGSSSEMLKEIDYQLAKKLILENRFEEAVSALQKINDYKDANELYQGANYQIALNMFTEGQYSESLKLFTDLGDYEESKNYVDTINLELDKQSEQKAKISGMELIETVYGPFYYDANIFVWSLDDELINLQKQEPMLIVTKNNSRSVIASKVDAWGFVPAEFSPDRERIAFFTSEGVLEIWDMNLQKLRKTTIPMPWDTIVAWSPDGTMILTQGVQEMSLSLWNLATESSVLEIPPSDYLSFSPDGQTLALYFGENDRIELWDIKSKTKTSLTYKIDTYHSPPSCFSPDGRYFAYGINNYVKVFDIENKHTKEFSFGSVRIDWCKWADNTKIAAGTEKEFVIWDFVKESVFFQKKGQYDFIFLTRFSPDGLTYETLDHIKSEYTIWDAKTHEILLTIPDVDFVIGWSPSGTKFAFVDYDYNVRIWGLP